MIFHTLIIFYAMGVFTNIHVVFIVFILVAMAIDPTVKQKYHSGYDECTNEVDRYLSTVDGLQSDVKKRLMDHLDLCNRQQSNVFPAHSHTSTLSAFQNLSRVSPGTSTIHPGTLVGPVSPPMYHSLLDMNKSHDASSDRMLHEYNKMTETSPNYHMLSKSLQLSTNKTQFRDRVQHGSEYPKEKPHTITRQKKLSENKDCIENNRQVQSPALLRQRISGTHIVGKENSTNNKELCPQNDCVRRFGENQPRPFGELNLNSFNNRINQTRSNETNKQNVSGRSSVSGSVAMVKEESMWRPW